MNVSTSLWMEMVTRERMSWRGRSTWWRRCSRSCSAWSPSAAVSSEKSKALVWLFYYRVGLRRHPSDSMSVTPSTHAVCVQAASPGHGAKGDAVETSSDAAGDLLPPPAERPELFSGGEVHCCVIHEALKAFYSQECRLFPLVMQIHTISLNMNEAASEV